MDFNFIKITKFGLANDFQAETLMTPNVMEHFSAKKEVVTNRETKQLYVQKLLTAERILNSYLWTIGHLP